MAVKRSFTAFVLNNFMDTIGKAVSDYVEENFSSLELETRRVKRVDEAFLSLDSPLRLHRVIAYENCGDKLNFDAVVIAEIEVFQTSHSQQVEDDVEKWFRVSCEVTVCNGFNNFQIHGIVDYDAHENPVAKIMSDGLTPIIAAKDLERHAEAILSEIYPEALLEPTKIDVRIFAERLGLKIEERRLSRSGTIFGQMIFYETVVEYFDLDKRKFNSFNADGGTIFVDPEIYFLRSLGSWNNTVIHECVHWMKHRKCIELERAYNGNTSRISCQVAEGKLPNKEKSADTDWMEWQANSLAPRILMPLEQFKRQAETIIQWYKQDRNTNKLSDIIPAVIYELADFYEVSVQSAKIRMIDAGYNEAIGAFEYIDGQYVQNHTSSTIERNQTYSIPMFEGLYQYAANADFRKIIDTGNFVYIDNHYCISSPKYVTHNEYGLLEMTEYALGHMDECCLVFERKSVPNPEYGTHLYRECVLFQSAVAKTVTEFSFAQIERNKQVEETAAAAIAEINEVREAAKILAELPMEFDKSLVKLMKWRGITVEKLAENALVHPKTIQRLRNNPSSISLELVVAVCIGLQLYPDISFHMIEKAGIKLRINKDIEAIYSHILKTRYKSGINECNELLAVANYPPLSGIE